MTQVTFCNPILLIDGREIQNISNVSISFPGGNQLNSLSLSIGEPDLDENSLFGKSISFYLNYGAQDNIPIFRGYVKSTTPSNNSIRLKCTDVRGFIKSKEAPKVHLDDFSNYDGYSLAQFFKKYIEENININKTYIGLNLMNDTYPLFSLNGERGTFVPYDLVTTLLAKIIDTDTDEQNPLDYIIDVVDDGNNSHMVFKKKKLLTDSPALTLSDYDGIQTLSYKKRAKTFVANVSFKDGDSESEESKEHVFKYGSLPHGLSSINVSSDAKDPAGARERGRLEILKDLNNNAEISIRASKGHYIGLESIVQVNVKDQSVSGKHRLIGKTISWNKGTVNLVLNLSQKPIKISDYILSTT